MAIKILKPLVSKGAKYAVAVPLKGGGVVPVQSYDSLKDLKEDYARWKQYAIEGNITKPVPIEFLDEKGLTNNGKCKVLTEIL